MRKTILILAVLSLIVFLNSCQKAEEVTVSKYFQAMKGDDRDTMAAMAYEPKDIDFKEFEILSIEDLGEEDIILPALVKESGELDKKRQAQVMVTVDKKEELEEIQDELDEARRKTKQVELQKKIDELTVNYEAEKQKVLDLVLKITKNKKAIEREKVLIEKSTGMRDNLEMFSGKTQNILVTVKVTTEKGDVGDYKVLLRKDNLRLENREQKGRIIVVKLMTADEYKAYLEAEKAEKEGKVESTEEAPKTEAATEPAPAEGEENADENAEENTEG